MTPANESIISDVLHFSSIIMYCTIFFNHVYFSYLAKYLMYNIVQVEKWQ